MGAILQGFAAIFGWFSAASRVILQERGRSRLTSVGDGFEGRYEIALAQGLLQQLEDVPDFGRPARNLGGDQIARFDDRHAEPPTSVGIARWINSSSSPEPASTTSSLSLLYRRRRRALNVRGAAVAARRPVLRSRAAPVTPAPAPRRPSRRSRSPDRAWAARTPIHSAR